MVGTITFQLRLGDENKVDWVVARAFWELVTVCAKGLRQRGAEF